MLRAVRYLRRTARPGFGASSGREQPLRACGRIISKIVEKAIALTTEGFDTGMININGNSLANPQLGFGGVKESRDGREHGGFGLKEFVNVKSIQVTGS